MKKTKYIGTMIVGIFIGVFGYAIIQSNIFQGAAKNNTTTNDYSRFNEVFDILQTSYYDQEKLNTGAMIQNAIKAYVDAIEDPYTIYMDAQTNSGFQEDLKGENDFEGIGAVISKKDYYVLIEELIKESPAFNAGLLPLDRIVMIETGSTKPLTINEAVSKIRGKRGSKVTLTIERINKDGTKEIIQKEVIRDKISVPSVSSKTLTGKDNKLLGYINISVIGEETENLLKAQIQTLKEQNIKGLILDLRGNGGGFLPIAVEIASHFIPKNKLIVSAKYKQLGEETFHSQGYSDLEKIPTIVLVDGLTASAGEIIALALQEQIGAKIVGTQTFGKGSIQTMNEFENGDSIKYTIGKRYSPSGKNIDKTGITPTIEVPFDNETYKNTKEDNQLEKAISLL